MEGRSLWADLMSLGSNIQGPWILMGDFNAVCGRDEVKRKSRDIYKDLSMEEFDDCITTLNLFDHPYVGCKYTWSDKKYEDYQARKLDKVLVNESWLRLTLRSTVEFLPPSVSDHSPAILRVKQQQKSRSQAFQILQFLDPTEFLEVVKKNGLRGFNKKFHGDIHHKVIHLKVELDVIQSALLNAKENAELTSKEAQLSREYIEALKAERSFLKQKARIPWLKDGDENTSFFHKSVKAHVGKSSIGALFREDGTKVEEISEIK
ncbi:hypothetical protein CRG98_017660 [Punica granatum]|uniref:Endonuclease/exonuclease/phosphatase domain-containing protein n=1 Tax=Punica granatum TaxID=22663 RepID=A0A2I0K046_PUNGR|nr:hypothetical protein CRG98_017660 [Punica granatum]